MPSFDIVSQIDNQEIDNAINQVAQEIAQRYDFKNSKSKVEWNSKEKKITIIADDEYKLSQVMDILQSKMVKREVPLKNLQYGKIETALGAQIRQEITVQEGISKENAKIITKAITQSRLKVQAQIMDIQIRVTSKKIDSLQDIISLLKTTEVPVDLQFINMRS